MRKKIKTATQKTLPTNDLSGSSSSSSTNITLAKPRLSRIVTLGLYNFLQEEFTQNTNYLSNLTNTDNPFSMYMLAYYSEYSMQLILDILFEKFQFPHLFFITLAPLLGVIQGSTPCQKFTYTDKSEFETYLQNKLNNLFTEINSSVSISDPTNNSSSSKESITAVSEHILTTINSITTENIKINNSLYPPTTLSDILNEIKKSIPPSQRVSTILTLIKFLEPNSETAYENATSPHQEDLNYLMLCCYILDWQLNNSLPSKINNGNCIALKHQFSNMTNLLKTVLNTLCKTANDAQMLPFVYKTYVQQILHLIYLQRCNASIEVKDEKIAISLKNMYLSQIWQPSQDMIKQITRETESSNSAVAASMPTTPPSPPRFGSP